MPLILENEHPIFYAAHQGNLSAIKKFIAKDRSLAFLKASNGNELILFALEAGHLDIVKFLLKGEANLVHQASPLNMLRFAIYSGQVGVIKWLVDDMKLSLEGQNNYGLKALMFAVQLGHFSIVKWLVEEKKVDVTKTNEKSKTVLSFAAFYGHLDILKWLFKRKEINFGPKHDEQGLEALFCAAFQGHLPIVKWLIDKKRMSPLKKNSMGFNVLLVAAAAGHMDIVQWLHEEKKNSLLQSNKDGVSPLMLAISAGQLNMVKFLIENGASLADKDNHGCTALIYIVNKKYFEIIQWLLETKKIDINANTLENKLFFDRAFEDVELLKIILKDPALSYYKLLELELEISSNPVLKEKICNAIPWLKQIEKPEHFLLCPISHSLMRTPVIGPDGYTYEKTVITKWLQENETSPITRVSMWEEQLISNRVAESAIDAFLARAGEKLQQYRAAPKCLSKKTCNFYLFSKPISPMTNQAREEYQLRF